MKFVKSSILLSSEKLISSILISISYFVLAGLVEPELLGRLSAVEALAIIFSFLSLVSLDPIFQNEAIKNNEKLDSYFYNAFLLKLLLSVIGYLLFLAVSIIIFNYSEYISIVIGTIVIFKVAGILQFRLIALNKNKLYCAISLLSVLLSFLLKLCILFFKIEALYAFFYILDAMLLFIFVIIINYNYKAYSNVTIDFKLAWSVIKKNYLFILSAFSILAFGKVDQLIIAKMLTFTDVANYALAMKVIGAFVLVSTAFNLTFAKNISKLKAEGSDVMYKKGVKDMMKFTFFVGFFLSIVNYFISPPLINFIYGNQYIQAADIVKYSTPLIVLIFLSSSVGKVLIVEGLGRIALTRNLLALFLSIILSIFLIPILGVWGALIGTIFSWFISAVLLIVIYEKTRFIYIYN